MPKKSQSRLFSIVYSARQWNSSKLGAAPRLLTSTMNLPTVVFRANAHRSAILSRSLTKPCLSFSRASRKYATHRQATESSSLLSQSLDTGNRANQRRQNGDSVGPFQLGVSQSSLGQKENVKKWSELSTGGKGTCHIFFHKLLSQ